MIADNKIFLHIDNIKEKIPITADIFLTDYCNNKCPYCTYARYGENLGRYTKYEDFIKYAERLYELGIRGFILTGGGEPTINPDFNKIAQWLETNNYDYGINTNFVEYKEINPVYLKISLDAWDAQSYVEKRGVDKYDQVISNIDKYLAYKKENNIKTQVGIQCLVKDITDIDNFYNAHKNLTVDYISFRPVESKNGSFYFNKNIDTIKAKLITLQNTDSRVAISFKWNEVSTKFKKCYGNWSQLAIDFDGNLLICCHRPFDKIGNILDSDIIAKKNNYKIDMSKCDIPCRLTGVNKCIKYISLENTLLDKNFI